MAEIYFACSIRGGRDDAATYAQIVECTKEHGTVLTEIFADGKLTSDGMNKPNSDIWKTDTEWIKQCDGMIAEVTNPSLGVGYEIALAESLGKPILALFHENGDHKLSAMIEGSPGVRVVKYTKLETVKSAIERFVESL